MAERPQPNPLLTTVTPIDLDTRTLLLQAVYIDSRINLDNLQKEIVSIQMMNADPLILKVPGNAYIVVLRFGAVVFWKCSESLCRSFLKKMQVPAGEAPREFQDTLLIQIGQEEDKVNFKDVWLKTLTLEHIKVISETFGQSVALKQCEVSVNRALEKTGPIVHGLKERGQITQSTKQVLQTVGFTMVVWETILSKLTLFDEPPETWHSERLSRLYSLLYDHFDIKKRLSTLQAKLTFLSDLNTTLMNVIQNRGSHRLELIVIILILIEILLALVESLR